MTVTADQIAQAVDELRYQDVKAGRPAAAHAEMVRRVSAMPRIEAEMLVIRPIWESVAPGTAWAATPEGIAAQIARAATALQARRVAVGSPMTTIEAVRRVTPEVERIAGVRDLAEATARPALGRDTAGATRAGAHLRASLAARLRPYANGSRGVQ
jgi:hypothetical protein